MGRPQPGAGLLPIADRLADMNPRILGAIGATLTFIGLYLGARTGGETVPAGLIVGLVGGILLVAAIMIANMPGANR